MLKKYFINLMLGKSIKAAGIKYVKCTVTKIRENK